MLIEQLRQPQGTRQPGRPSTDNEDVRLDFLAFGSQLLDLIRMLRSPTLARARCGKTNSASQVISVILAMTYDPLNAIGTKQSIGSNSNNPRGLSTGSKPHLQGG